MSSLMLYIHTRTPGGVTTFVAPPEHQLPYGATRTLVVVGSLQFCNGSL